MQSVRPTLATESSTADEPPLLRETKLQEHTSEDEKPQLALASSLAASRRPSRSCASASLRPARSVTQTPTPKPRSGRLAPRAPSTRARLWPGRCAAARWPRGRARRGGVRAMRPIFLVRLGCVDQRVGCLLETRPGVSHVRRTQPASRIEPRLALCRNSLARVPCLLCAPPTHIYIKHLTCARTCSSDSNWRTFQATQELSK